MPATETHPTLEADFAAAREPDSAAARIVLAKAEEKRAGRDRTTGIKGLYVGKSDTYDVCPFDIHIKPGWNTRDFSTPENQAHVLELAASIAVEGVREPMTAYVDPADGLLYLTNGECRLRATVHAINVLGAEVLSVPVRMEPRGSNDADRIAGQLTRNSGKPLTPMEKAEVVRRLLGHNWTISQIAQRVGLTESRVRGLVEVLELPEEMRQQVREGIVAASEAVRVARTYGDEAPAVVERAAALSGANGKKAGRATRATLAAAANGTAPPAEPDDAPDVGAELQRAHAEIDQLNGVIDSLNRTDESREITSLHAKFAQLNGRLQQEMTTGGEAKKQAERYGTLLKKIRIALGIDQNADILPAIEALKG